MSWQFRKSFTVIPGVRLNLTNRGLSTTIGAAPFSINIGARGVYRNISIPGTGLRNRERIRTPAPSLYAPTSYSSFDVVSPPVREIHSANTDVLTSDSLESMRQLLATTQSQREELKAEVSAAAEDTHRCTRRYQQWEKGFLFKRLFKQSFAFRKGAAETSEAKWNELQEQLRQSTIQTEINIDPDQQAPYSRMVKQFLAVANCTRIWNIITERSVNRIVERSNFDATVNRTPVAFGLDQCDLIQWDQPIPHLRNLTGGDMYVYPGFILYRDSKEAFALIDFHDLRLRYVPTQFTETEQVPSDSPLTGYTWAKCNKDGSPDGRFRDNYRIPVAHYGGLYFSSHDGLDVRYLCSNPKAAEEFVSAWTAFQLSFHPEASESQPKASKPGGGLPAPYPGDSLLGDYEQAVHDMQAAGSRFAAAHKKWVQLLKTSAQPAVENAESNITFAMNDMDEYLAALREMLASCDRLEEKSTFVSPASREGVRRALNDMENTVAAFQAKVDSGHLDDKEILCLIHAVAQYQERYSKFLEYGNTKNDQHAIQAPNAPRCVDPLHKPNAASRSFFTKVAGVTFEGRQRMVARCWVGERLILVRDPNNPFDPGAIKVMRLNGEQLGFIPAHVPRNGDSSGLAFRMDQGDKYQCRISDLTGGGEGRSLGANIEIIEGDGFSDSTSSIR